MHDTRPRPHEVPRRTVFCVGLAQLINWGASYYLIGGFAPLIASDLGWSLAQVHAGFSVALLFMGLVSPLSGRLIDRIGGRGAMTLGACIQSGACLALAMSFSSVPYFISWALMGIGMRLTLYEAAFASFARIAGRRAASAMSVVAFFGGLASTVFWPLGMLLASSFGWRGATLVFAGLALTTIPLTLTIPAGDAPDSGPGRLDDPAPRAPEGGPKLLASGLYALIFTLTGFLAAALSAHMITILTSLGLAISSAVWISSLRGIGQSSSRLCQLFFGRSIDPTIISVTAVVLILASLVAGRFSGLWLLAAILFAFGYGAGNGLLTLSRGTLPLVLFDAKTYGAYVGRLLAPSFLVAACAPLAYALLIEHYGVGAAIDLSIGIAVVLVGASLVLRLRFGADRRGPD